MKLSDWKPAPRTEDAQCFQDKQENFVQIGVERRSEIPSPGYRPSDQVLEGISNITGGEVTVEELRRFQILSGIGDGDGARKAQGQWCSMPAPDTPDDQDIFPKEEIKEYWEKCVMPHAGYFNVLVCNKETSNVTDNFEANLGLMATNQDVCYPLHAHVATEVYWQVGGQAVWRTWENCGNATAMESHPDGQCLESGPLESWSANSTFGNEPNSSAWHQRNASSGKWEYKDGLSPHWHPSPVSHETDTTANGTTHLLNFYLWAKPEGYNNYQVLGNIAQKGLGYFDMHQVLKAQNGTKLDREKLARKLIGTCATVEQVPTVFHKKWEQDQQQWREGNTGVQTGVQTGSSANVYAVQCPANRSLL